MIMAITTAAYMSTVPMQMRYTGDRKRFLPVSQTMYTFSAEILKHELGRKPAEKDLLKNAYIRTFDDE
jgi:hypothetical protein